MLAMMVDLEDDDEWAMADELEDDDFDRYSQHHHIMDPMHIYLFLVSVLLV